MRRLYLIARDLHLYFGLFLSPFILVFSVSVFYLVHGLAQRPAPGPSDAVRTAADLNVPPAIARMQGRARVDALRPILEQLGVRGEIDFVRQVANEHRLIVPVRLPDRDTIVNLDYDQRTATVTTRRQSLGDALVYLHKMPGPHNVDVRGNSRLMRAWRVLADATASLLLPAPTQPCIAQQRSCPKWSGWVYRYVLKDSTGRMDLAELRALQDFTVRPALQAIHQG